MSQGKLAKLFDVDVQTIARYENNKTKIPYTVDICLRNLFLESIGESGTMTELFEQVDSQAPVPEVVKDGQDDILTYHSEL